MRTLFSTLAAFLTLSFVASAPNTVRAQEVELIAGWDFSQYQGDGFLSIDGVGFTDTLDANYSSLDPTFGAGIESAAFGTMYMDGSFGSTAVPVGTGTEAFTVTQQPGQLPTSNCAALNPCENFGVLQSEGGQLFVQSNSMLVTNAVSVVFQADLSSVEQTRDSWRLSFGAKTFSGIESGNAQVSIDFSTDGSSYANVANLEITPADTQFIVSLGDVESETAFARFNFSAPEGIFQPLLDNVAIEVPEPIAALSGATAVSVLAGLAAARRRPTRSTPRRRA